MAPRAFVAAFLLVAACSGGDDDGVADFIDTAGDDAPPVALDSPMANLEASFEDPPVATPDGDALVVTVVLTNPSEELVRLEPCPAHSVTVGESASTFNAGPWLLNCEAVPEIEAQSAERFEVVIPVSEEESRYATPLDSVSWRLIPIDAQVGVTQVIVERSPSDGD